MSLEATFESRELVQLECQTANCVFHAAGTATQNARLPRRSLVRGTTWSPRAAERTAAARVGTDVTGTHKTSPLCNLVPCQYEPCKLMNDVFLIGHAQTYDLPISKSQLLHAIDDAAFAASVKSVTFQGDAKRRIKSGLGVILPYVWLTDNDHDD